jgi:4-amino-4-deoxy-L-arabinose transferase-like glycosyltransferase
MVFAAFTASGMLSFFWYIQKGKQVFFYLFFVFTALAFMTKGPLAVALIFPALGIYLAVKKDFSIFRRKETYIGFAIFGAIVLPWYMAVYFREGFPFFYENIIRQNFVRFFDAWSHKRPIWYYLTTLPLDFFPWSLFLPMGIWLAVKKFTADPKLRFFLIWFGWMFLLFSLSSGKISKYMLPLLPPLSLIAANVFMEEKSRYRTGAFVFIAVLFLVIAGVLFFYKTGFHLEFHPHRIAIGSLSAALALSIAWLLIRNKPTHALVVLFTFMMSVYVIANVSIYEKWNPLKSPRIIAEKIRPFLADGTPWVYYGSMRGVYIYYVGKLAIHVDEHDSARLSALPHKISRFFVLSRKRDLHEITDVLPEARQVFEEKVGDTPMVLVEYGR